MDELQASTSAKKIGALARPDDILFIGRAAQDPLAARSCAGCCATSPKARALGDTTTLADPAVVSALKKQYEEE